MYIRLCDLTLYFALTCLLNTFSGAGSHVGNLLGQGDYNTARLAALINIALVFTIGGSVAMTLLIARDSWSALFSSNEEVQVMVSDLIPYVATYIIFDTRK